MSALGYPLYVNGKLFEEPVTISHVPGTGAVDPSMGAIGSYVAYRPDLGQSDLSPGGALPPPEPNIVDKLARVWRFMAPVAAAAGVYHGYKRNRSVLWGIWWGVAAAAFPIITVPVALAQGFGKPKMAANRRRRRNPADGDYVVFETMPDQHRDSHREARNWGTYPHNGAKRVILSRDEAEERAADDPDGYNHIVRGATERDLKYYANRRKRSRKRRRR